MKYKDVRKRIKALRRRRHNVKPREIEDLAIDAGWVYDRTEGSHATYIKNEFPSILTIKQGNIGGDLVAKLLNLIEASLSEEGEE